MDESDHSKIMDYQSTFSFIEMTLKFRCSILAKQELPHTLKLLWSNFGIDAWLISHLHITGYKLHPQQYQDVVLKRHKYA